MGGIRETTVLLALLATAWLVPARRVSAQVEARPETARLFFDCQAPGCRDTDFFIREIPFVDWVRDPDDADVHVLVRSERTGGGGVLYRLAFLPLTSPERPELELTASTPGDATVDEQRSVIAGRLSVGLVPFLLGTEAESRVRVLPTDVASAAGDPDERNDPGSGRTTPVSDPWDFWVFRASANGFLNGQATSSTSNLFANLSADRTTEAWKISLGGNYSRNVQRFEVSDGSTVRETRRDWGTEVLAVRSLGERWAIGLRGDLGSSTFFNQDRRWSLKPGLEFNFFPYEESSQRSLTLQYLVGPNRFEYTEETIFLKTSETLVQQSLTARLALVQPWGSWNTSLTGDQYLHDPSKYSVTLSGNFNVRLFRGFSIRMGGNYSWIRDQLFVSAGGATDEQILLQQRQLETSYRYFTSFGIEYRFGSIFNNVVNPRFGGPGGGGMMFF